MNAIANKPDLQIRLRLTLMELMGSAIGVAWQAEPQADLSGILRFLHDFKKYGEVEETTQGDKASKIRC